ncbi:hypothetical protein N9L02_02735 [Gammaproteobacteria bacterium]|nr:hypothetical protein [Gammaproteobacteria bacterium]
MNESIIAIKKFFTGIGLNFEKQTTDINLLKDIFENTLLLKSEFFNEHLGNALKESTSLSPLFNEIVTAISNNQPILSELCLSIHHQKIKFKNNTNTQDIDSCKHTSHLIFLLNLIIPLVTENSSNFEILRSTIIKNSLPLGFSEKSQLYNFFLVLFKTKSFFCAEKFSTIEYGHRITNKARKKKKFDKKAIDLLTQNLQLNIIEAAFKSSCDGYKKNSAVGLALTSIRPKTITFKKNNPSAIVLYDYNNEWDNLYESWNLLFVATSMKKYWPFLASKLLFPTLLKSKNDEYLYYRAKALYLITKIITIQDMKQAKKIIIDHSSIYKLWEDINYKHAINLIEKEYRVDITNKKEFNKLVKLKNSPGSLFKNSLLYLTNLMNM